MKTWLFSLHKPPGNNAQFLSKAFNGQDWSDDMPLSGTGGISNTPAAVEFNSNLYVFYQRDHTFYFKVYDGEVWTAEALVTGTGGVNNGVAATVCNNLIYLFYSNPGATDLMCKTYDGTTFGPETTMSVGFQNLDTPAAVTYNDMIYVFGRGPGPGEPGNVNRFWFAYSWSGGNFWQHSAVPATRGIGNGPGAAAYNNQIFVMYNDPDGIFCYKTFTASGSASSELQVTNTPGCFSNASAVAFQNLLYILYQGPNGQYLYQTTTDGREWTGSAQVPNTAGLSFGPATLTFSL